MYDTVQVINHDTTQARANNVAICIRFLCSRCKAESLENQLFWMTASSSNLCTLIKYGQRITEECYGFQPEGCRPCQYKLVK
jgi:hypothetical protein